MTEEELKAQSEEMLKNGSISIDIDALTDIDMGTLPEDSPLFNFYVKES